MKLLYFSLVIPIPSYRSTCLASFPLPAPPVSRRGGAGSVLQNAADDHPPHPALLPLPQLAAMGEGPGEGVRRSSRGPPAAKAGRHPERGRGSLKHAKHIPAARLHCEDSSDLDSSHDITHMSIELDSRLRMLHEIF